MQLADALVDTLAAWEVGYVFGVSGANIEHFHDAIHRAGSPKGTSRNDCTVSTVRNRTSLRPRIPPVAPLRTASDSLICPILTRPKPRTYSRTSPNLRSVLAKTEVGAAFMADGHARVHRKLGVCCSTSGGGMMNLAVGVAESYADSVPVLAIVGQIESTLEGKGGFQDSSTRSGAVNALPLWQAITKRAARVESAAAFWPELQKAGQTALSGRPGPVALLLTRDMFAAQVDPRPDSFPTDLRALRIPPAVDSAAIDRLDNAIRGAQYPVMVVGRGVDRSSLGDEVTRFAVEANIPAVTTVGNPAGFPDEHRLNLGRIGATGNPSAHRYLNEKADLVVAVGTDLDAMVRGPISRALDRARLVIVTIDPSRALRVANPEVTVAGDIGTAFALLRASFAEKPYRCRAPRRYRRSYMAPAGQVAPRISGGVEAEHRPILPSDAVDAISRHLPDRSNILFDAGNCGATGLHMLRIPHDSTATVALGMGGMGYAIAAAVGVQLGADEGSRTVVLCGDGSFLMHGSELHTAMEFGLPILYAVFNNSGHGMCETRQNLFFDGRVESSRYHGVDFVTLGRGLDGGRGLLWTGKASTQAGLVRELEEYRATGRDRPGLLEIELGREEVPPFAPFLESAQKRAGATVATHESTVPA